MPKTFESHHTLGEKIVITLFCSVILLGAGLTFWTVCQSLFQQARPYFWEQSACTILESRVVPLEKEDDVRVRFRYRFHERDYESNRVRISGARASKPSAADALHRRYTAGREATCFVNPANPTESVLERDGFWGGTTLLILLPFLAAALYGVVRVWKPRRASAAISERHPRAGAPRSLLEKTIIVVFGLVFAGLGAAVLFLGGVEPCWSLWHSSAWVETPCRLAVDQPLERPAEKEAGGRPRPSYTYTFAGVNYVGDRYDFGGDDGKKLRAHAPNSILSCFVNPRVPEESVIVRRIGYGWLLGLFGLPFFLIGIAVLYSLGQPVERNLTGLPLPPKKSAKAPIVPSSAPAFIERKPSPSTHSQAIASAAVAVVLLGFAVVLVCVSGLRGTESWVFVGVLSFLGLGLAWSSGGKFLILANPAPGVLLRPGRLRLGDTLEVEVRGKFERMGRLRLALVGTEGVTLGTHKNVKSEWANFAVLPIVDTTSAAELTGKILRVLLPKDSIHTFNSGKNWVTWNLHIVADFLRGPAFTRKVEVYYRIEVLPLPCRAS